MDTQQDGTLRYLRRKSQVAYGEVVLRPELQECAVQQKDCKDAAVSLLNKYGYASMDQVKQQVREFLKVPTGTKAKQAVGHKRYMKMVETVRARLQRTAVLCQPCPLSWCFPSVHQLYLPCAPLTRSLVCILSSLFLLLLPYLFYNSNLPSCRSVLAEWCRLHWACLAW